MIIRSPARPPTGATRITAPDPTVQAMIEGRRADTGRRRQRVLTALAQAAKECDDDLAAARAANRELMAQLNRQESARS